MEHPRLKFLCMDVSEQAGSVVFLRKIKEGVTENSYGIHVAALAGIPKEVIDRAKVILSHIQNAANENPLIFDEESLKKEEEKEKKAEYSTPGLFSDEEIIISEILSSDVDNMTPMAALQLISRWKKELSGL